MYGRKLNYWKSLMLTKIRRFLEFRLVSFEINVYTDRLHMRDR